MKTESVRAFSGLGIDTVISDLAGRSLDLLHRHCCTLKIATLIQCNSWDCEGAAVHKLIEIQVCWSVYMLASHSVHIIKVFLSFTFIYLERVWTWAWYTTIVQLSYGARVILWLLLPLSEQDEAKYCIELYIEGIYADKKDCRRSLCLCALRSFYTCVHTLQSFYTHT